MGGVPHRFLDKKEEGSPEAGGGQRQALCREGGIFQEAFAATSLQEKGKEGGSQCDVLLARKKSSPTKGQQQSKEEGRVVERMFEYLRKIARA